MIAGDEHGPSTAIPLTFELEEFMWGAPDRLRLSGRFTGLGQARPAAAELVLRGPERMHRLKALPDTAPPEPEDGSLWSAEFAWQEPPVAFDAALLQLGPEIAVELPEPGAERRVLRARGGEEAPRARGVERVRREADLQAAQTEIRELRAAAERAQQELDRAREDLRAERERHAGDVERFREGLAAVQESAAEALAAEQSSAQQAQSDLAAARAALAEHDAALEELRGQREAAQADAAHVRSRLDTIRAALEEAR